MGVPPNHPRFSIFRNIPSILGIPNSKETPHGSLLYPPIITFHNCFLAAWDGLGLSCDRKLHGCEVPFERRRLRVAHDSAVFHSLAVCTLTWQSHKGPRQDETQVSYEEPKCWYCQSPSRSIFAWGTRFKDNAG